MVVPGDIELTPRGLTVLRGIVIVEEGVVMSILLGCRVVGSARPGTVFASGCHDRNLDRRVVHGGPALHGTVVVANLGGGRLDALIEGRIRTTGLVIAPHGLIGHGKNSSDSRTS